MVDRKDEQAVSTTSWILSVVLSVVAVLGVLLRGVKWAVRASLIEEGLIRPGRAGDGHNWPNDWHSLPETLQGIYEALPKPPEPGAARHS